MAEAGDEVIEIYGDENDGRAEGEEAKEAEEAVKQIEGAGEVRPEQIEGGGNVRFSIPPKLADVKLPSCVAIKQSSIKAKLNDDEAKEEEPKSLIVMLMGTDKNSRENFMRDNYGRKGQPAGGIKSFELSFVNITYFELSFVNITYKVWNHDHGSGVYFVNNADVLVHFGSHIDMQKSVENIDGNPFTLYDAIWHVKGLNLGLIEVKSFDRDKHNSPSVTKLKVKKACSLLFEQITEEVNLLSVGHEKEPDKPQKKRLGMGMFKRNG